jgi:hypothetical protein
MEFNSKIQKETEQTLKCLEGIKRAEANPFIFDRVSSAIDNYGNKYQPSHKLQYGFVVMLILFVNFISIMFFFKSGNNLIYDRINTIKNVVTEYNINNNINNYFTE